MNTYQKQHQKYKAKVKSKFIDNDELWQPLLNYPFFQGVCDQSSKDIFTQSHNKLFDENETSGQYLLTLQFHAQLALGHISSLLTGSHKGGTYGWSFHSKRIQFKALHTIVCALWCFKSTCHGFPSSLLTALLLYYKSLQIWHST